MSCRKNPSSSSKDLNAQPPTKKTKIDHEPSATLPFTKTEFINNEIHVGDKFVSLIGYVDNISNIRTIKSKETNRTFELFKFVINNNEGSRISCCAFNTDATAVSAKILLNQILVIQNATAVQSSSYNDGNVAFELQRKHFTELTNLGCFDILQTYGNIDKINLDQVSEKTGHIKTEGYVRDQFVIVNKMKSNEYSRTITDGNFKLEVVISNVSEPIKINRGQKIRVIGEVQEYGNQFRFTTFDLTTLWKGNIFTQSFIPENESVYLKIQNMKLLEVLEGPSMPFSNLILGGRILRRNIEG